MGKGKHSCMHSSPQEKSPGTVLNAELNKKFLLARTRTPFPGGPVCSLVTIQPELRQFASDSHTALKLEGESDSPRSNCQVSLFHSADAQSSFEMAWQWTLSIKSLRLEAGMNVETDQE
jgi:hypothetical protein